MKKPFLYSVVALVAIAAALFAASFVKSDPIQKMESEAAATERNLIAREQILDRYSEADEDLLQTPPQSVGETEEVAPASSIKAEEGK